MAAQRAHRSAETWRRVAVIANALLPLLIVLLAFAVRFHKLDAQSLWNDEGNSLRLAERSVSDLIDAAGRDIHPPGYYLALKGWIALAGTSEFSLRALSLFEGVLAVAVTVALGRALFARPAGLIAGLPVALSPFAVYYSQETRMYAQLALLSAASMWAFVGLLTRVFMGAIHELPLQGVPRYAPAHSHTAWRWALALALINAAGLYTQYSFPFTMIAQGVVLVAVIAWRVRLRTVHESPGGASRLLIVFVALNLLTLALFAPWLPTAWEQVTSWPSAGADVALGEQLRTILTWIVYGNTAGEVAWLRFLWPALLIGVALWTARDWRGWLPLAWAGTVISALFVSGAYREANLKFLLPAQIATALLIGQGAHRLWAFGTMRLLSVEDRTRVGLFTRREQRAIALMLAVMCVFLIVSGQATALDALYTDPAYARDDYRAIARTITANAQPGDAIILDAPNQSEVFSYYYGGDLPVYGLPRGLGGDDAQTYADVQAVIADHRRVFVLFWGEEERDPNRVVQATLDSEAYPVDSRWVGDVRFALYAVLDATPEQPAVMIDTQFGDHITLAGYALSAATLAPGDVVGVTLFWTTDAPLDVRYKVTVQLLAPDGRLIAQHDAEPGGNRALTTTWTPGDTVRDTHGLVVPPDLPPGEYPIVVGLYDINAPLERLPVRVDGAAVGETLTLARLSVAARAGE